MMLRRIVGMGAVLIIIAAGCGGQPDEPAPGSTPPAPSDGGTTPNPRGTGESGGGPGGGSGDTPPAEPPICSAEYVYGVVVIVTDTRGRPIHDAEVVLTDGDYAEWAGSGEGPVSHHYFGAGERPGHYTVSVSAERHQSRSFSVTVKQGPCHVNRQEFVIKLRN